MRCAAALALALSACSEESSDDGGASGGGQAGSDPFNSAQTGPSCQVGQTFTCMCAPGMMGTQLCQSDGLTDCRCGLADTSNTQFACNPSMSYRLPCTCEDGRNGVKRCGADGILQSCNCDDLGAAGSSTTPDPDRDAG